MSEKHNSVSGKDNIECCGCGACATICPKHAISMVKDEFGHFYPEISDNKCIDCGMCIKICRFDKPECYSIKESYAAVNKNKEQLGKSSSGGMFSAIAGNAIKNDTYVCGANLSFKDNKAIVKHILINGEKDISLLQGSKYVYSVASDGFEEVLTMLKNGNRVLFSGTPCQVDAVKSLAGSKYQNDLYTIDIICHGVPSQQLFNDYLELESQKRKLSITNFVFRNKKYGWGLDGDILGNTFDGKNVSHHIEPDTSSYYHYFLEGDIYRDSCYNCPYAQKNRTGDITIGDYWGVEKYDSALMKENGGIFSGKDGVSCVFINTDKGKKLWESCADVIDSRAVEFDNVAIINTQLNKPASYSHMRQRLLTAYIDSGYKGIQKIFFTWRIKRKIKSVIKKILPNQIVAKIQNKKSK